MCMPGAKAKAISSDQANAIAGRLMEKSHDDGRACNLISGFNGIVP
jgi:hypothetical protein